MLPLYLLNAVKGEIVVVELKNGGIANGTLENCDSYMNVTLTDACISLKEGDPFNHIDRVYLKGIGIKLFKMGNEFIEKFKDQQQREKDNYNRQNNNNNNSNSNNNRDRDRKNRNNNTNRRNNRNSQYNNSNGSNDNNQRWGSRDAIDVKY
ncbi:hypothetical protein CANINC_003319 [Pichia inconspicua]|uniref:LSM complex subunit LSM4 n=1 Tax=Pichia inconspicua TaxID=52247 RepID=A0A4T0WZ20_9ASCO|nr:hypothetical protein CANINC_003319 [[Candida] inconspicua]